MKENPKVSICMPVYNRQDYIHDAIKSALAQAYENFELIVTDNCSTDNTPEIVKQYAQQDNRIKYFKNEKNIGICSSMNRGILLAKGEYIKFLFSDDKLDPKCLEIFTDKMDKHPKVSLITSFTKTFGTSEHIRNESYFPGTGELDGRKYQKDILLNGNWPGSPSTVMFRREHMYIGMFNPIWRYWLGDLDMSVRLLGIGNVYVVPEILSYLRIHDEQESSVHAVDFRLIRERLQIANMSFQFPNVFGEYTSKEQKNIHYHLLKRLVREGFGKKGFKSKIGMFKIGLSRLSYSRTVFLLLVLQNLPRLFRKSRFSE